MTQAQKEIDILYRTNEALQIAVDIARRIREVVVSALEAPGSGEATGVASSGDTTFAVDDVAEAALKDAITATGIPIACYSEDKGLRIYGSNPEWVLIVDPLDGTRPAAAGLDSCVVSVAVTNMTANPRFSDVVAGVVYELHRERIYCAVRGGGAYVLDNGKRFRLAPHPPKEFCELRWTIETVARPAETNFAVAAGLIDATSLRGSVFALSSSAFSLCQIAAGRFSGMVDLSARLLKDLDPNGLEACRVGHGRIMGLWGYDVAAAALIAQEAGCTITDAWGNSFDNIPLTRTQPEDMASCICAASLEHHSLMLEFIERGFAKMTSR